MSNLHFEKVGIAGTIVTVACCLGFGPLLALLSAVGAAFLINDAVLAPLLVGFLALGSAGLVMSMRRHHQRWPLILHLTTAVGLVVFTFIVYAQVLIWVSVVGLLAVSVWDFFLQRACSRGSRSYSP